jgi:hypothetical protein
VAALLTALGAMLTGMNQQFGNANKLARGLAYAGRLRSLEVALSVTGRDPLQVSKDFEELIASDQDFLLGQKTILEQSAIKLIEREATL